MPNLIKFILLLTPFISLYVAYDLVFPYITGKNFAFRIMVELVTVIWFGLIVVNKRYRLKSSTMLELILFFTLVVGVANLFGVNPYNSMWSSYERMDGYITLLHLCMYFILVSSMFQTKTDWLVLLNSFVLVSVLLSGYIIWEKAGIIGHLPSDGRPIGTIGNSSYVASYCVLAIVIKSILICNIKRFWFRLPYFAFIGLDLLLIYFSATRGAVVGLAVGVIAFCLMVILMKGEKNVGNYFNDIRVNRD